MDEHNLQTSLDNILERQKEVKEDLRAHIKDFQDFRLTDVEEKTQHRNHIKQLQKEMVQLNKMVKGNGTSLSNRVAGIETWKRGNDARLRKIDSHIDSLQSESSVASAGTEVKIEDKKGYWATKKQAIITIGAIGAALFVFLGAILKPVPEINYDKIIDALDKKGFLSKDK